MATFNGVDILYTASYPSKVSISPMAARNIYTNVPGVHGAFSEHLGYAPRKIVQEGILAAANVATLRTRITTVLSYIDHNCYVYIDNNSGTYYYVQLESFAYGDVPGGQNSRWTSSEKFGFITYYRATFIQLSPNINQP